MGGRVGGVGWLGGFGADLVLAVLGGSLNRAYLARITLCSWRCHLLWVCHAPHPRLSYQYPILAPSVVEERPFQNHYYLYRHIMPSRGCPAVLHAACRTLVDTLSVCVDYFAYTGQLHSPCFTAHRVGPRCATYAVLPCSMLWVLHEPFVLVWC